MFQVSKIIFFQKFSLEFVQKIIILDKNRSLKVYINFNQLKTFFSQNTSLTHWASKEQNPLA